MKRILYLFVAISLGVTAWASEIQGSKGKSVAQEGPIIIETPGTPPRLFGSDWFVQGGFDMELTHPYGYSMMNVFPNGMSFGVNAAVGKWFSPQIATRVKLGWENGIPFLENKQAKWLDLYSGQVGHNMDAGGRITLLGDVMLDVRNVIGGYNPERKWHLIIYPRAGVGFNLGDDKQSSILGAGVTNTYRLNDRIELFCDASYHFTSSGYICSDNPNPVGMHANAYANVNAGVQINLGQKYYHDAEYSDESGYSFWEGWFLQVGTDMMLQNPYRKNFAFTIPKGMTFGLDGAFGKYFSPEMGVRFRLNWDNGIIPNNKLEWVAEDGSILCAYMDVMFDAMNALCGRKQREWTVLPFARAGLGCNLALKSASPMVGGGIGTTHRISDHVSLYADMAYQIITSEFTGGIGSTGMDVSMRANGFMDFHVGIQYNL